MPGRENVLYVTCIDDRIKIPEELKGQRVNQLRLPGGILFPDLCAHSFLGGEQTFEMKIPVGTAMRRHIVQMMNRMDKTTAHTIGELVLLFSVDAIVGLKNPTRIYLATHSHCGAANIIGFNEADKVSRLLKYRVHFQQAYPDIDVRILNEEHSECGEHHMGHKDITVHAVAA